MLIVYRMHGMVLIDFGNTLIGGFGDGKAAFTGNRRLKSSA
jgi:hypothetical protein